MALRRRRDKQPAPSFTVDELSASENEWRDRCIRIAAGLAQESTGVHQPLPLSPVALEATLAAWRSGTLSHNLDVNNIVNVLGIAFGDHLAARTGLRWVIATQEGSTDMALHGQPGDILVYPTNLVAKRVVAGGPIDAASLLDRMSSDIAALRSQG